MKMTIFLNINIYLGGEKNKKNSHNLFILQISFTKLNDEYERWSDTGEIE